MFLDGDMVRRNCFQTRAKSWKIGVRLWLIRMNRVYVPLGDAHLERSLATSRLGRGGRTTR